jgi:class 3 adenylate cyclase
LALFRRGGRRTEQLLRYLTRRAQAAPTRRRLLDEKARASLFRRRAVVFTDTADFTARTARDGILHFLMVFERLVRAARPAVRRCGGELVKVEADSLLLRFDEPIAACRGVSWLDAVVRRTNRGRPENERLRFSYGIGYGDVLDLEDDMFGLEVNMASKLGEDLAKPGEVLLTPAAAAVLDAATLARVVPYRIVTFEGAAIPVQRLKLSRG